MEHLKEISDLFKQGNLLFEAEDIGRWRHLRKGKRALSVVSDAQVLTASTNVPELMELMIAKEIIHSSLLNNFAATHFKRNARTDKLGETTITQVD